MSEHVLPPFSSVLKSREVEDPVNLWFNRPLAYGFVALVFRTPITPNQVTLLATTVGLGAALCVVNGGSQAMLWGGILLWTSAILDGADGILARAKQMQSEMGRALDGTADLVVAGAMVLAAAYHLWTTHHSIDEMVIVPVATVSTVFHIYLYDYYKETYLALTRPDWSGRFEARSDAHEKLRTLQQRKAPLVERIAAKLYVDLMSNQYVAVAASNRAGLREGIQFPTGPKVAEIYRRHNRGPIRLWTWISLAPHTYLMALSIMADRIELYLWLRLVAVNALFVLALFWQRTSSRAALNALGVTGPAPAAS